MVRCLGTLALLVVAMHRAGATPLDSKAAHRPMGCIPAHITDDDPAGCGPLFPRSHPKNAFPLAHNNDVNGPFFFRGFYHLFMQADFTWVAGWNGAIGLAHLASKDGVRWEELPLALLPRRCGGPPSAVGQPGGNATAGYYHGTTGVRLWLMDSHGSLCRRSSCRQTHPEPQGCKARALAGTPRTPPAT